MSTTPNLLRIGSDEVALHAILAPEGVVLIDAGLPGHLRPLERALTAAGRSLDDIRGVVLTHGDTDHIGVAEHLRAQHGVPIHVHTADAARARGEESTSPAWGPWRLGPTLGFLAYTARHGGLRPRHPREVVGFTDGDVLDLPASPRIIGLPGHSPGSVAVHVPLVDALFVGDALTTRSVLTGRRGPQPAPFTDDPAAATAALAHLEGIEVERIVPGHGAIFAGGVDALLRAYRAAA